MKKFFLSACLACAALTAAAQAIPRDEQIENQVKATLATMSLDDKVGQMCELACDLFTDNEASKAQGKFVFSKKNCDYFLGERKVGSILNVPLGVAQTPEVYAPYLEYIQKVSMEKIGIPDIYGLDQNHGTTYTMGGTLFPQNLNMAATFDRELTRRGAEICAYETRASMVPWTYNPTIDLARNPAWPRFWENFGEDAYMNAEMAIAATKGFQGDDPNHVDLYHIAACLKHYMGYGVAINGRDRTPSSINRSDLREKHFAPFLAAAQNGALSIMVNSGNDNGMPFHANYELLTKWMKQDLQWDGMIVTDWADIDNLYKRDHVAHDKKEAIAMAINAGIDMSMDPYDVEFCSILKQCVEEGLVSMERIDDAVSRVLRLKYRLGLFDNPTWKVGKKAYPLFGSEEFAADSRRAAMESMVLLKNDPSTGSGTPVLPLKPGQKVLLTGPNANSIRTLNGGWSYTWQGHKTDELVGDRYNTILEAMTTRLGEDKVSYVPGVSYYVADGGNSKWNSDFFCNAAGVECSAAQAVTDVMQAAKDVDVIVACIGETSYCETPGNLSDLNLSENQKELVRALGQTGKPVVLVLNEGRPRIIADIEPVAKAVVDIMLPANYGGEALASLLTGDENFSGKLPFSYPRYTNALSTYDYKPCESVGTMSGDYNYDAQVFVQWPYGAGLSYTTYSYNNIRVSKTDFTADDELTVSVDVKNTGSRAGKEAVLLFSHDDVATSTPDIRRLRQFTKIELQPGEQKTVSLTIPAKDLAFVGYDGKWRLEKGTFTLMVGNQHATVNCTATKVWDTPNR